MERTFISKKFTADLQATCASLGYVDERGIYQREPDCLESVKDLIRFMKRDDELCTIRRQLGCAAILQTDLLPLVKQIGSFFIDDQEENKSLDIDVKNKLKKSGKLEEESVLLETVIRLIVNLTQPARLCFNDRIPESPMARQSFIEIESHLQKYKEAFVDEALFSVLSHKLGALLKLDWESRQEEDRLLIERILLLVRNILQVPPDRNELRTDDDASVHDQILWSMNVGGFNDLLLYLANSGEERHLVLHVAEIISLILREQVPDQLACCGAGRAKSEKEKDKRDLEEMLDTEAQNKRMSVFRTGTRHSTFGGTYRLGNIKSISERDILIHSAPTLKMGTRFSVNRDESFIRDGLNDQAIKGQEFVGSFNVDLNKKKSAKKKPRNRAPVADVEPVRRSTFVVRSMLKEFCAQFLESCYNPFMRAVKDALIRSKAQENDESYFLRLMTFLMKFNRKHNFHPALVSETLSTSAFHYVTTQIERFFEMTQNDKKQAVMWSKRTHLALRAYRELLEFLVKMDQSTNAKIKESSRIIKSNIFYTMEYRDLILLLVKKYENTKQSKLFLRDLLETNHLFMRMLEHFHKENRNLVVQRKKKRIIRKKSRPEYSLETEATFQGLQGEKLWEAVSDQVSLLLQGHEEIPNDIMPFDAASDVDIDQQGTEAVRTIQECLMSNRPGEAVALFRSAREVWPDRGEFKGSTDAPEDEFLALRDICLHNFTEPSDRVLHVDSQELDTGDDEDEGKNVYESSEQSFSFEEFVHRYASPLVVKSCVAYLEHFKTNDSASNHCALKLLHRIGFDCKAIGILFQASLFNVFRKLFNDPSCANSKQFAELKNFAIHVVRKFMEIANSDKKIIIELFFWKSMKEAVDLTGSRDDLPQSKNPREWSEEQDEELKFLFEEVKDSECDLSSNISNGKQPDLVDRIISRMSDQSKTRRQVIREMVFLGLITNASEIKKKSKSNRVWSMEELDQLKAMVPQHLASRDPMGEIMASYKNYGGIKRRTTVRKKIIEMGLIEGDALKKKRKTPTGKIHKNPNESEESEDDGMESENARDDRGASDDDERDAEVDHERDIEEMDHERDNVENKSASYSRASILDSGLIKRLKSESESNGLLLAISWLRAKLDAVAKDREDDTSTSTPLVPITEDHDNAMTDEKFIALLLACGLSKPSTFQEKFWRIPHDLTSEHLGRVVEILSEDSLPQQTVAVEIIGKQPLKKCNKINKSISSDSEDNAMNMEDSDIENLIIDEGISTREVVNSSKQSIKRKKMDLSSDEDLTLVFGNPEKKTKRFIESDDDERDEVQHKNLLKFIDSDED